MLSTVALNAYYGKSHVVRDLSICVPAQSIVGMLGRNGVGKTTILKTIMALVRERTGIVKLGDRPIDRLSADLIARAGIGYVPQGRQLFPHLSVYENFVLAWHGRTFDEQTLERGLKYFPPVRNLLRREAGKLSGGEQQMVAIGRALLNDPQVVLMDEPSEGLSPLYVSIVREALDQIHQTGIAVLLVEQNLQLALKACQFVYFIEKGTATHFCSAEEARQGDVVHRYLGVHFRK